MNVRSTFYLAAGAVLVAAIALALALVATVPEFSIDLPTSIGGGMAYVFLAAMTATSFDRSAAWLGPRRWRLLHKTGMYYCWYIFFVSYLPRMLVESLWYFPFVAVLLGSIGIRFVAPRRQHTS